MKTLSSLALSGAMVAALAAGASAQTVRTAPGNFYGLVTGRSAYVDKAPRSQAGADGIVMGLRVPYGPRTPEVSITR